MSLAMPSLGLFQGFGVELEYMIVNRDTLQVMPITDKLLEKFAGEITDEVENGDIGWSNELVLHVVELKTARPEGNLDKLPDLFNQNIRKINQLLAEFNAVLMPSAMHPFMNPDTEMKIWPHGSSEIYEKYNQIFDCRGHGWSNLQSVHLNLPFSNDAEFGKLHAAIRVILPLLPGIAASSPIKENKLTGYKDTRLEVYKTNQIKIPSIAGSIIPEPVYTKADYNEKIFQKIFKDIKPYDPAGLLQHEWLNSRGATARFYRNAIEIRVLDLQECPKADIAVLKAIISVLKSLIMEKWENMQRIMDFPTDKLAEHYHAVVRNGEETIIKDPEYLALFGLKGDTSVNNIWKSIIREADDISKSHRDMLNVTLEHGTLSTRITKAYNHKPDPENIKTIYKKLIDCLEKNSSFIP
jgi:glutamate---cysteine ligase / carboxylate-amine ligase